MKQEDKELLLKDLCARLPHGIKAQILNQENIQKDVVISVGNIPYIPNLGKGWFKECKPYLFPLSSMTDEQKREEYEICKEYIIGYESDLIDFYNRNHIDYRGLIPKGLAIDATGLNIY